MRSNKRECAGQRFVHFEEKYSWKSSFAFGSLWSPCAKRKTCRRWFGSFKRCNFDLTNEERGRPPKDRRRRMPVIREWRRCSISRTVSSSVAIWPIINFNPLEEDGEDPRDLNDRQKRRSEKPCRKTGPWCFGIEIVEMGNFTAPSIRSGPCLGLLLVQVTTWSISAKLDRWWDRAEARENYQRYHPKKLPNNWQNVALISSTGVLDRDGDYL